MKNQHSWFNDYLRQASLNSVPFYEANLKRNCQSGRWLRSTDKSQIPIIFFHVGQKRQRVEKREPIGALLLQRGSGAGCGRRRLGGRTGGGSTDGRRGRSRQLGRQLSFNDFTFTVHDLFRLFVSEMTVGWKRIYTTVITIFQPGAVILCQEDKVEILKHMTFQLSIHDS